MRVRATKYLVQVLLFLPPTTGDIGKLQREELLMTQIRGVYTLDRPLKMIVTVGS